MLLCALGAGVVVALGAFALQTLNAKLELILMKLDESAGREVEMLATNDEILAEVEAQGTIADSVLVIVQRLANESDPTKRQAIFDGLKRNRVPLEAAIVAGTPQETPVP